MSRPRSILDPAFRYTSSANTDLRKTFARVRRRQQQDAKIQAPEEGVVVRHVALVGGTPIEEKPVRVARKRK